MKRYVKIIGIIIASILLIYTLFIIFESIRLSNNPLATPLIIFEESYAGKVGGVTYKSLGFTLTTKFASHYDSNDLVYPVAEEFYLFDKFLLWAWIS